MTELPIGTWARLTAQSTMIGGMAGRVVRVTKAPYQVPPDQVGLHWVRLYQGSLTFQAGDLAPLTSAELASLGLDQEDGL